MAFKRKTINGRFGITLIELVTIVVVLGILSAVALPVYLDYRSDARVAACKGALGAVRTAIADYHGRSAGGGGRAGYPTASELQTAGVILFDGVPDNPFDTDSTKNNVNSVSGERGTVSGSNGGWNYNPATGRFWANTNTPGVGENAF